MDRYGTLEDEAEADTRPDDEPVMDRPPEIGVDERRMHVRAYNHWVSLLNGRSYPSIHDLEPDDIEDFGAHSVLLDFTGGSSDPRIAFLGGALRAECALGDDIRYISQVPSRSLLSRLTDHYLQIIANCAPIGFEAEFLGQRGNTTMYRGILMPFSSDGDTIDFIYGVINWKELADGGTTSAIEREVDRASAEPQRPEPGPIWADGPSAAPVEEPAGEPAPVAEAPIERHVEDVPHDPVAALSNPDLADRLELARESADMVRSADIRSRAALYIALGQAYDFALAAEAEPDAYAALLAQSGIKAQERAPMTPIAKLVFGVDYDKSRLTEFAAALAYGRRQAIPAGEFVIFLEDFPGGLKGIVQAERAMRAPKERRDAAQAARTRLRSLRPLAFVEAGPVAGDGEFVLMVARREADGRLAVVAPISADDRLIDLALRKSEG